MSAARSLSARANTRAGLIGARRFEGKVQQRQPIASAANKAARPVVQIQRGEDREYEHFEQKIRAAL
jgi:hypothetical protein